jgi:hypothetical protein
MVIIFLKNSIKSGYKPDMKYKSFNKPLYIWLHTEKQPLKYGKKFLPPPLPPSPSGNGDSPK